MLRRAVHLHAVIFAGNGVADLGFQIKLFLTTYIQLAMQLTRRTCQRADRITFLHSMGRVNKRILLQCLFNTENRLFLLVFNLSLECSALRLIKAFSNHRE